tara:strand:- start:3330 stop:3686 length:357 start_codon:yes stop_codon:yes gene_type:complete
MDIWVVCDVYECEYDFSTHLTEKGALLEVCARILAWMDGHLLPDCDSEQERVPDLWKEALKRLYRWNEEAPEEWVNFDIKNWKDMDCDGLWRFYEFISEFTWESSTVDFTIQRTGVKG